MRCSAGPVVLAVAADVLQVPGLGWNDDIEYCSFYRDCSGAGLQGSLVHALLDLEVLLLFLPLMLALTLL